MIFGVLKMHTISLCVPLACCYFAYVHRFFACRSPERQAAIRRVASTTNSIAMQVRYSHLRADNTIGDVIAHPAFAGFGGLILPWDNRRPDGKMRLREISALLPYHSEVNLLTLSPH